MISLVTWLCIVSRSQTTFFFYMGAGKRVWYMDDTISVQTSTQSRVGDDWCQQQLLKLVKFMSALPGEPFTNEPLRKLTRLRSCS